MSEFNYLLEKIMDASLIEDPFEFLYIEDWLSNEHFELITQAEQINLPEYETTEEMIKDLQKNYYSPVVFPGTVTDIKQYLKWFHHRNVKGPSHAHDLLEGFGLVFRMNKYREHKLKELVNFLNSKKFLSSLMSKFGKSGETRVETAIQKYLTGYEISPHPDIRKKCLTYMVNINPSDEMDDMNIHTHFMTFKKDKEYIPEYWDANPLYDRCWVPWNWCETKFMHTKNNSITMFAPANRTIHAVKLDYDHCKNQRTQIYGNLWYLKSNTIKSPTWRDLP